MSKYKIGTNQNIDIFGQIDLKNFLESTVFYLPKQFKISMVKSVV